MILALLLATESPPFPVYGRRAHGGRSKLRIRGISVGGGWEFSFTVGPG